MKNIHRFPSPPQAAAPPPQTKLSGWDGWPNGFFRTSISSQHVADTNRCIVNWVCDISSDRRGSPSARTAARGLETQYTCLGVIECASRHCTQDMQIAPERQLRLRQRQLDTHCLCGRRLRHLTCGVTCSIYTFRHGVHYVNAGPSQLLFGDRSVTKISPLLFNKDRLAYERTRILKPTRVFKDNHFLEQIAAFEHRHPNFAPRVYIEGKVTVIVLQSPFMRRMLLKDTVEDDAVNGIVSDASHGFFKQRNELLMVSSVFEPKNLQCWVPAMMSYFNGSTVDHYRIHFFHLLRSIAEECDDTDETIHIVSDDMFASTPSQVVDFSDTQRKAFIEAFIDFWMDRAGTARSPQQLEKAAISLLRGCEQHFRSQVTRVKKIGGVVAP
ncbi:hypothetical protein B0H14DRAFT_2368617, partial [Mycena olivaceomarginata]